MYRKLIIEGNSVYEIDEECLCHKQKEREKEKTEEEKKQGKEKGGR